MNREHNGAAMEPSRGILPMNLQFFAEGGTEGAAEGGAGGTGDAGAGTEGAAGKESGSNSGMSFDDFLKDPKNQSEFDKRVAKALETNRSKMQADIDAQVAAARTEAEQLAKMSADQKAQYEREKKDGELAKREAEITKRELMATAKEQLVEKGLPASLASILNYTSAEECKASIEAVEKAFQEQVEKAVEDKLRGGKPPKKAEGTASNNLEEQVLKAMLGK